MVKKGGRAILAEDMEKLKVNTLNILNHNASQNDKWIFCYKCIAIV